MAKRIQLRRGLAAAWTSANPTLLPGEVGLETDTDKFKVGDGATDWHGLPYGGIEGVQGPIGPAGPIGPIGPQGPIGETGGAGLIDGGRSDSTYGGVDTIEGGDATN